MTPFPPGMILFYSPADPAALDDAKAYIARHNLTSDDVRLLQRPSSVVVECKREVVLVGD